jgi:hypothetical protein
VATIVQDFFTSQKNNVNGQERIGKAGRLWYEPETNTIRVSDGITPGGIIVSGGGGTGGGIQGPRGYIGSRGAGFTGSQGSIGNTGYAGSRGDTGYIGSQGDQGLLGYSGSQGNIGYTGSVGELGYVGSAGDIGYTGSEGFGYTGSIGELGYVGSAGDLGYVGSTGDIGYTGSVGELGYVGSAGDLGYTGSEGFGYSGSRGAQGLQGPKGDALGALVSSTAPATNGTGELWYDAVSGVLFISYNSQWIETTVYPDTVFSGATPPSSPNNNDIWYDTVSGKLFIYYSTNWIDISSTGDIGYTGSAGYQGRDGYTGSAGYQGTDGYVGSAGIDGFTGSAGISGIDGYVGSAGTAGIDGYVGSAGYTGSRGSAGVDGRNVTASTTAPVDPIEGQLWYDTVSGRTYVYYSGTWVAADPTELTTVSSNPPTTPTEGSQWYDTVGGRLYIYYNNNWVDANPVDTTGFVGSVAGNGYTGSAGINGAVGSQGPIGYTGSGGSGSGNGYTGSLGIDGYVGSTGSNGIDGYVGSNGIDGYVGSAGVDGYIGSAGVEGYVGSQGDLGYTGSQSYTGSQGYIGSFGYSGSQGPYGYTGSIPGTYVSGITAGTGTAVSAATGAVTVWMNTGTLVTNAVNLVNGVNRMTVVTAPTTLAGASGDVKGNVAFDDTYVYYCKTSYGGSSYSVIAASGTTANWIQIRKGAYPTPQAGWTITFGTPINIISVEDAGVVFGYDSWKLNLGTTVSSTGGNTYTITDTSNIIWVRTPWNAVTTGTNVTFSSLTVNGNTTVNTAGSSAFGTGAQLYIDGTNHSRIDFSQNFADPVGRSTGTRILFVPGTGLGKLDTGIGMSTNTLWTSVQDPNYNVGWYAGDGAFGSTPISLMILSGSGNLTVKGSVSSTGFYVNNKQAVNGPAFRAYIDSGQAITSGSQQKVTFGTETFDTNANFASSRFTPTVEGYFQLNATVRIDGTSSTAEGMITIWKNGSEYARGNNTSGAEQGTNFYSMQVSDIAYANGSSDYFEIYIQQGSGGNRNTTAGSNISYFSGSMVRGA